MEVARERGDLDLMGVLEKVELMNIVRLIMGLVVIEGLVGCQSGMSAQGTPVVMSRLTEKGKLEAVENADQSDYQTELLGRMRQSDAPGEVYALERYSTWGGAGDIVEVVVKGGRAELFVREGDRHDRYFYCWLAEEELRELRAVAQESDRVPGLEDQAWDGVRIACGKWGICITAIPATPGRRGRRGDRFMECEMRCMTRHFFAKTGRTPSKYLMIW